MTLAFNICIVLVLLELLMLCLGSGSLIFLALWLINLGMSYTASHNEKAIQNAQAAAE